MKATSSPGPCSPLPHSTARRVCESDPNCPLLAVARPQRADGRPHTGPVAGGEEVSGPTRWFPSAMVIPWQTPLLAGPVTPHTVMCQGLGHALLVRKETDRRLIEVPASRWPPGAEGSSEPRLAVSGCSPCDRSRLRLQGRAWSSTSLPLPHSVLTAPLARPSLAMGCVTSAPPAPPCLR